MGKRNIKVNDEGYERLRAVRNGLAEHLKRDVSLADALDAVLIEGLHLHRVVKGQESKLAELLKAKTRAGVLVNLARVFDQLAIDAHVVGSADGWSVRYGEEVMFLFPVDDATELEVGKLEGVKVN